MKGAGSKMKPFKTTGRNRKKCAIVTILVTFLLVGNVWGHYTMRINGPIFFHSVPYFSKGAPWNNLEYLSITS